MCFVLPLCENDLVQKCARSFFFILEVLMNTLTLFLTVLATVFIAEMGDKTQLMLIAMTSKYKLRQIIVGTAAAILVLNALAVLAGGILNEFLKSNLWVIKLIACAAFFYFSLTSLIKDDDEEEAKHSRFNFAPLAVFATFFVAELGDKTQLTAITFGATNGLNSASVAIWIASSIGLFAADIIGLLIGHFLHGKTPDGFFKILAFAIFAFFGFANLPEGLYLLFSRGNSEEKNFAEMLFSNQMILPVVCIAAVLFAATCVVILVSQKKKSAVSEK